MTSQSKPLPLSSPSILSQTQFQTERFIPRFLNYATTSNAVVFMCAATARGEWGRFIGGGGFSHESERDLALMVTDFLENGASSGDDSFCGSADSDGSVSDLRHLADNISFNKHSFSQYEIEVKTVVHSVLMSMKESDLHLVKTGLCSGSCIRFSLVKHLRFSGYDAAVCLSRWQGSGKLPGGDHEYIDVVHHNSAGNSERLIIDIDFRSHFEIARAVDSYDRILKSLPVVYVGSLTRLKQYLQVMVEATKSSLKQNSMPLPPWRSLAYLQAKWYSPFQRQFSPDVQNFSGIDSSNHKQCTGHLKRVHSLLQSEMEEGFLKPVNSDTKWRKKFERRRHSFFRPL